MFGAKGGLIFTFMFLSIPASANVTILIYKAYNVKVFYFLTGATLVNIVLIFLFDQTPLIVQSKPDKLSLETQGFM